MKVIILACLVALALAREVCAQEKIPKNQEIVDYMLCVENNITNIFYYIIKKNFMKIILTSIKIIYIYPLSQQFPIVLQMLPTPMCC